MCILQLEVAIIIVTKIWRSGCKCSYIRNEIHSEFDYCVSIFPPFTHFGESGTPETLSDSLKE